VTHERRHYRPRRAFEHRSVLEKQSHLFAIGSPSEERRQGIGRPWRTCERDNSFQALRQNRTLVRALETFLVIVIVSARVKWNSSRGWVKVEPKPAPADHHLVAALHNINARLVAAEAAIAKLNNPAATPKRARKKSVAPQGN
jgi:hypothetical protein